VELFNWLTAQGATYLQALWGCMSAEIFDQWGPALLVAAVFVISLAESLAVVGLLVPGVALLLSLTLAAVAAEVPLPLWLMAGTLGAFLGDGLSFWLGQRAGPRVHHWRFFQQHPQWLHDGERFFRRYGVWSIMVGRFIGPLRPVVPLVAGTFEMPGRHFWLANAVSSPAWATAYLAGMYWLGEEFLHAFDTKTLLLLLGGATLIAFGVAAVLRWYQQRGGNNDL